LIFFAGECKGGTVKKKMLPASRTAARESKKNQPMKKNNEKMIGYSKKSCTFAK
jgi:hypothetical protein